jgi:hypothetical protein
LFLQANFELNYVPVVVVVVAVVVAVVACFTVIHANIQLISSLMQQIFIDLTYARPKMAVNCFAAARQTLERAAHRNKIENFQNFVSRSNRNLIDFQFRFFFQFGVR